MKKLITVYILLILGLGLKAQIASISPKNLSCEYLLNPLGLDEAKPRFSWTLKSNDPALFGQAQKGYRIVIANTIDQLKADDGKVWDSGWVNSSEMQLINYAGKPLLSDHTYFWKVAVKDEKGRISVWSKPAYWSTGLFKQEEWKAKWIGAGKEFDPALRDCNIWDPWLRKSFVLKAKPKKAMLFVASIGYHEIYVNGKRIGNDVLSPAVTDHIKRARYVTYDLAPALQQGKNVVAIWLGTSWSIFKPYYTADKPKAPIVIAQADIDGFKLLTDESWKTYDSPGKLIGSWHPNNMGGELWDAGKEIKNWNTAGFNDNKWERAVVYHPKLILSAQQVEPNRLVQEIKPVDIESRSDGSYRVDMGVNFTGWMEVKLQGDPGARIDLLFSERKGQEMTYEIRSVLILDKTGKGVFKNRFNYNTGRWMTLKGLKQQPDLKNIKGWMVRTGYAQATTFSCADALQNWMYNTINWTYENLSVGGFIVDCTHRERLGYGGDAHATHEEGIYNYKTAAFYTKWMEDWRDVQGTESMTGKVLGGGVLPHTAPTLDGGGGPDYGGIVIPLPWAVYLHQGDKRILERNFELIKDWLAFLDTKTKDNMLFRFGGEWDFIGDWLWPGTDKTGVLKPDEPGTLFFSNCYRVYNLRTAAKIAKVLGKNAEAERWTQQADLSSTAIHAKFYNSSDHSYADSVMSNLAIALIAEVVPADLRTQVMQRLEKEILVVRKGHIGSGIMGGALLFKLLREMGRDDLIYSMTSQTTYPGWGYMKENGATSIWEAWENEHRDQTLMHSSYLYPGAWYIDGLAGIKQDVRYPGFRHFILRPPLLTAVQLPWVKATLDSPAGLIKNAWQRRDGSLFMQITVPPNTTAELQIQEKESKTMSGNTKPIKTKRSNDGYNLYELPAGVYDLKFTGL